MKLRTRDIRALTAVLLAASALAVATGFRAAASARAERDRAVSAHATALRECAQLRELRARERVVRTGPAQEESVLPEVRRMMQEIGLAPERLRSVETTPGRPVRGSGYLRQAVTLTLEDLSPADTARLLAAWRNDQPQWAVRSVRMDAAARGRRGRAQAAPEDRFSVTLTIETLHFEHGVEESDS